MAKNIAIEHKNLDDNFGFSKEGYDALMTQCQSEISTSESFMLLKWQIWRKRIKLMNNQKRNDADIGDPLIFPQFQTLLAALYNDELNVKFNPREQGDIGVTENLNPLYEYDAVLMNKPKIDYQWDWNAMFFGRALVYMFEYDRKKKVPSPEVINMMTFYRDPNAKSVNGDSKGRNAMRWGGRPILLTKKQLEDQKEYKNINKITVSDKTDANLAETEREIKDAQGLTSIQSENIVGENSQLTIYEHLTHHNGKKVVVGLANGNTLLVRYTILKDQEEWGIIERSIYPDSLSWDGVNVVDLLEDKQRARSVLMNAALFNVNTNVHTMYMYDISRINSASDLDFAFNKHIGVQGDPTGAVQAIPRAQVSNEVQFMLDFLQKEAQVATGVSEIKQGAMAGSKRTATEIATVSEGAETRFSLSAKIFGWSEKEFARYWYKMYKMHFNDYIDKKILRLNGLNGLSWRKLGRDNIIAKVDPDVEVKSNIVSEARRVRELQDFNNSFQILASSPNINLEFLIQKNARLNGTKQNEMDQLFEPTPDQIIQREENEAISQGKFVPVNPNDDDRVHLVELQKSTDGGAKDAHQRAHIEMIKVKAKNQNIQGEARELETVQREAKTLRPTPELGKPEFNAPKILQTA